MGMAGKASPSIEGRRNGPGEPAAGSGTDDFDPFYERLARRLPNALMPRVSLPLAVALAYYTLHRLVVPGTGEVALYPELLALVIFVIPSLLYLAMATFRELADQMDNRVGTGRPPAYRAAFQRLMGDRRLLLTAAVFGSALVAVGIALGIEGHLDIKSVFVISVGYFLVGFLCGLASLGFIGIVLAIRVYVREDQPRFDVTAPDGCGGMLFLGRAITYIGILTLIGGVLISSYTLLTEAAFGTSVRDTPWGPQAILLWTWVALAYALSVLVLLAPAIEIHRGLHAYKVDEDRRIEEDLARLEKALGNAGLHLDRLQALRLHRDDAIERRRMLYTMSSWPFSIKTNLKYAVLVALNGALSLVSAKLSGSNSSLKELIESFLRG